MHVACQFGLNGITNCSKLAGRSAGCRLIGRDRVPGTDSGLNHLVARKMLGASVEKLRWRGVLKCNNFSHPHLAMITFYAFAHILNLKRF